METEPWGSDGVLGTEPWGGDGVLGTEPWESDRVMGMECWGGDWAIKLKPCGLVAFLKETPRACLSTCTAEAAVCEEQACSRP